VRELCHTRVEPYLEQVESLRTYGKATESLPLTFDKRELIASLVKSYENHERLMINLKESQLRIDKIEALSSEAALKEIKKITILVELVESTELRELDVMPFTLLAYFENRGHLELASGSNSELESIGHLIRREKSLKNLSDLSARSSKIAQGFESG